MDLSPLWTPYPETVIRTRCERHLHRIVVDPAGRVTWPDHDMAMEALARALGGAEMRCPAVIEQIRGALDRDRPTPRSDLPEGLQAWIKAARHRQRLRKKVVEQRATQHLRAATLADVQRPAAPFTPRPVSADEKLWANRRERQAYRNRLVNRLAGRTGLRRAGPFDAPPDADLPDHHISLSLEVTRSLEPCDFTLNDLAYAGAGPRTVLGGTVRVFPGWVRDVVARGLGVVDGRLVVQAGPSGVGRGVAYSFADMTPRGRARRSRRNRHPTMPPPPELEPVRQMPLPDVAGATETAQVMCLEGPVKLPYDWQVAMIRYERREHRAVREAGERAWRIDESWTPG